MSTVRARKTKRIKLTRSSNGMLMTPEEFDAVTDYDELFVYELIHGVLIVSPPPGESERDPNGELDYLLRLYRATHAQGAALDKTLSEQYIALPDSRRRADRAIWVGLGRVPNPQTDVPAIIVEFVSKRKRDRVRDYEEKKREYRAIGVQEYWIIDRFERTMTVFRNTPDGLSEVVVNVEETYRTPLLPGFELPLAQLLKLADDWAGSATRRKTRSSRQPKQ
ncbi:MAG: Uma2 family endonuclease [Isosphaerales bacterium]